MKHFTIGLFLSSLIYLPIFAAQPPLSVELISGENSTAKGLVSTL